jgi:glycosyltransferase involved in cell wall biosynthesis
VKVAFDGVCLDKPITGVGRAFATGLAAYAELAASAPPGSIEVVLLLPHGAGAPPLANVAVARAPRGALRRQLVLPSLLRELRADLLHSPVAAVPLRAPCPTIATVHDLPWLGDAGERTGIWRRFATRRSLRAARLVIAPSTFTQAAAARIVDAGKVRLVPHGTPAVPSPPDPAATDARRGPLLVLGDDRPRKNRDRLRAAHALARRACPDLPDLAFVGPPDRYVDETQKRELLQSCRALAHVATFEGFGLPVLEAMAHGAPVVAADIPPLREIAAGAALFVPPRDVEAIAAALVRIHADAALRRALAQDGWQRARAFAPAAVAASWLALHREVCR